MYLMILDSVKENNQNNQILSEASLMRSALLGNPAILSPNQALDSLVLQEIVLQNNNDGANHFCDAVGSGLIQIALPEGHRDLIACCETTIGRGIKNREDEFFISGLAFLYEKNSGTHIYPYEQRSEVASYILECLRSYRGRAKSKMPTWLTAEQRQAVEQYIESIYLLNDARPIYCDFVSQKQFYPIVLTAILDQRIGAENIDAQLKELIIRLRNESAKEGAPRNRSNYYFLLDQYAYDYDAAHIEEARTIIDIAYNRVSASSIRSAYDKIEEDIPHQLTELTSSIVGEDQSRYALHTGYSTSEEANQALDWEIMNKIYAEVSALAREKGIEWQEALELYYVRESRSPFLLASKYIGVSALKVAVSTLFPVGGVIDFFLGLAEDELTDRISDRIKVPGSARELRKKAKETQRSLKLLDSLVCCGSK